MMVGLGFLMISNVPYLAWPTFNARTVRGVIGLVVFVGLGAGLFLLPKQFFFPVGMTYVISGVLASVVKGLFDRPGPFTVDDGARGAPGDYDDDIPTDGDYPRDGQSRRRRRRGLRGRSAHVERVSPEETNE
jgi:hypothetical protein